MTRLTREDINQNCQGKKKSHLAVKGECRMTLFAGDPRVGFNDPDCEEKRFREPNNDLGLPKFVFGKRV
jgi:hypothetical protein